jgi:choline oxidase
MTEETSFDYVIVGGGTAGCILAARLAEDRDTSVCLLEAGPSDEGDIRVLELRRCVEVMGSELDWDYSVTPQERGNRDIRVNRARVLGGCSSHNAAIAFKTPDVDLRTWEELGATGWGPEACRPYFDRLFATVHTEYGVTDNEWEQAAIEAAREAGYPTVEMGRKDVSEGAGWFLLHKRGLNRESSAISYLHPLDQLPPNLTLVTDCEAVRLVLDEELVATGVETTRGTFTANREVVVSGGVINTPKLLMHSGIGPAEHLREMEIPVQVDLPVGEHLLDHPEGVVMWESTAQVPLESSQDWECGLFAKARPDGEAPDLLMPFGPVPYDLFTVGWGCPTVEPGRAFSIAPHVLRPRSEGTVRLSSPDPSAKPLIDPRYHTDPDGWDESTLLFGMRLARKLAEQPALKDWVKRELAPGSDVQSDEELSEFARRTGNTTYHPVGTCRMGDPADERTVVDPELRVKGVGRLRVADASIFPSHVGVNPVFTTMMVGEKAADVVRGRPAPVEVTETAAS